MLDDEGEGYMAADSPAAALGTAISKVKDPTLLVILIVVLLEVWEVRAKVDVISQGLYDQTARVSVLEERTRPR